MKVSITKEYNSVSYVGKGGYGFIGLNLENESITSISFHSPKNRTNCDLLTSYDNNIFTIFIFKGAKKTDSFKIKTPDFIALSKKVNNSGWLELPTYKETEEEYAQKWRDGKYHGKNHGKYLYIDNQGYKVYGTQK